MAIVKMNKFTLFAFEEKKDTLLENLQKLEEIQFVDLKPNIEKDEFKFLQVGTENKNILELENKISKIKFSLDYLTPYSNKKSKFKELREGKQSITFDQLDREIKNTNWMEMYDNLKEKEDEQNYLKNEKIKILSEIENLTHWLNFDAEFKQLKDFKLVKYFLGTIPSSLKNDFVEKANEELENFYIEIINEERDETYILVISQIKHEDYVNKLLKEYGFSTISLNYDGKPKEIINNYDKKIENINIQMEIMNQSIESLIWYEDKFKLVYEYYFNKLNRAKATENFIKTERIIVIQGWNTIESNEKVEKTIKNILKNDYYLIFDEVAEEDDVPILLKNNGFVEPFESITAMYSMPNYNEVDPTPMLSIFYFIFFGMMLSDAGYGMIMVIGTLISLKFFKFDKAMKNFMKLFLYLGISTVIWGAVYGGWFGDAPKQFLSKSVPYLINPQNQIMFVLGLSAAIGIVHIFIGLGMKAYLFIRQKRFLDALFDVGLWYISLIGIFMMIGRVGGSTGKILMIIGFVGLVLTQGRDAETIGGKIGGGIYGLYGITGYIGDIVSYSRLLALGLATGFIANAFNLMINLIPSPFKYIVGPLIFVGGHIFNLGVNALGAYVHSSRLQYLEFFNKFYEGGGKIFTPFKFINKYLNVTDKKGNLN